MQVFQLTAQCIASKNRTRALAALSLACLLGQSYPAGCRDRQFGCWGLDSRLARVPRSIAKALEMERPWTWEALLDASPALAIGVHHKCGESTCCDAPAVFGGAHTLQDGKGSW